jgi:hypoxanthine phosphoribosyltransferase
VAAVRVAVRRALADLPAGSLVLASCSGGPDSLALAAGLAFVAPRSGLRAGALIVDHAWDAGSADRSARVAAGCRELGLEPVRVLCAPSPRSEGAARDARRAVLLAAAERLGAPVILLGHTLDDQAETVLLRLARGSGARSLAGIAPVAGPIRRPLLGLRRAVTRAACAEDGLTPWDDPTNADPAFARARVRSAALPALEEALGPGVAEALARTATLLRADADDLDARAEAAYAELAVPAGAAVELAVAGLAALSPAVRGRVLRRAALAAGSSPGALSAERVAAVDALVTRWRGQGAIPLPSQVAAARADGRIRIGPSGGRGANGEGTLSVKDTAQAREAVPSVDAPAGEATTVEAAAVEATAGDGVAVGDREHPGHPGHRGHPDIAEVLVSAADIQARLRAMAGRVDADYAGRELLLVAVLKGAVMVMADLARTLTVPVTLEFMAVSSYGSSTSSSGVVRILKDLDRSIEGRDVLVVEDIIDSGLTLSWLLKNLRSRNPRSLEVLALLRKPEALTVDLNVRYVGFDIPSAFVVGYGLDYAERYRALPFVGTLTEDAIARGAH